MKRFLPPYTPSPYSRYRNTRTSLDLSRAPERWTRTYPAKPTSVKTLIGISGAAVALITISSLTGCAALSQSDALESASSALSSLTTVSSSTGGLTGETTEVYDALQAQYATLDFELPNNATVDTYDATQATTITIAESIDVSGSSAESAVSVDGNVVTISAGGTYVLKGSGSAQIIIDAPDTENVQIVLDGVEITGSEEGPTFWAKNAKNVFVTIADNTQNTLSDNASWVYTSSDESTSDASASSTSSDASSDTSDTTDSSTNDTDEPNATLYSQVDLYINGGGVLNINATTHNAITSKDDLGITDGTLNITASHHGITGKDSVIITGGKITIDAEEGSGIRSTNDTDETRGYVALSNATINIEAGNKAISAESLLRIESGAYQLTSADDALHSNNNLSIEGGTISLSAGDDGVHAENYLLLHGGELNAIEAVEGVEARAIEQSGARITLNVSDDGINATTGSSTTSEPGGAVLYITGGYTEILNKQQGDSLDSNGDLYMSGGTVYISGTTSNGDGALDFDGAGTITGGTIIIAGSSGMAQTFDQNSTQPSLTASVSGSAGDTLNILDQSGEVLFSYTAQNDFTWVLASSPVLVEGESYTISINNDGTNETTVTASTTQQSSGMGAGGQGKTGSMNSAPAAPTAPSGASSTQPA